MLIKIRRAAHRLTGIVDDEIEPVPRRQQMAAERFHAWRVTQIKAEDFQAMTPFREVSLLRITRGGVTRETGGDNELSSGSQ